MCYGHRCVTLDSAQTGGQAVFSGRTLGWPRAKIGALFFFGLLPLHHISWKGGKRVENFCQALSTLLGDPIQADFWGKSDQGGIRAELHNMLPDFPADNTRQYVEGLEIILSIIMYTGNMVKALRSHPLGLHSVTAVATPSPGNMVKALRALVICYIQHPPVS
jgi:hypothetical protein